MTNYCVVYYYPDGYGNADKVEFEGTNEQCLEYIKNKIGGDYGTWHDCDGNTCYHESEAEGCGGYYILES